MMHFFQIYKINNIFEVLVKNQKKKFFLMCMYMLRAKIEIE